MAFNATMHPLTKRLMDAGLIPPNCGDWNLHLPVNDIATITAKVYVEEENFERIVEAACIGDIGTVKRVYTLVTGDGSEATLSNLKGLTVHRK